MKCEVKLRYNSCIVSSIKRENISKFKKIDAISISVSVCLFLCLSVCPSLCLSLSLSLSLCVSLSIYIYIYLSIYLSVLWERMTARKKYRNIKLYLFKPLTKKVIIEYLQNSRKNNVCPYITVLPRFNIEQGHVFFGIHRLSLKKIYILYIYIKLYIKKVRRRKK